jgi:hypothetical protein
MSLFTTPSAESDRWMAFVKDYLKEQVEEAEYFNWMRHFVGFFQISRHLDDYIDLFLAIDRIDRPFQLGQILNSRASVLLQGGGVSAPPLSRVLGIGACFVVRELVRQRVLKSQYAVRHCFVPSRRVRTLFQRLGCDGLDLQTNRWDMSQHLYRFASEHLGDLRATFADDFDIPFQFLAEDSETSRRLAPSGELTLEEHHDSRDDYQDF